MQSKLLRSIQERSVRPVGAVTEVPVDVRLLSATHKDLGAEVQAGQFRQDLYYRLNVIQIRVPPLRERLEDLMGISSLVLERLARDAGVWPAPRLTRDALVHLSRYPFPGNVRELENLLHRAVALSGAEELDVYDLGLPESVFTDSAAQELDQIGAAAESAGEPPATPPHGAGRGAAAERPGEVPRRRRARHPRSRPRAPSLQSHRGRHQPGPVAAPDALPDGAPQRQRRRRFRRRGPRVKEHDWRGGWLRRARSAPSPNFGPRPEATQVDLVVLHSISLPPGEYGGDAIERLFANELDWTAHPYFETIRGLTVSSHFLIRRDGALVQFVSCDDRAWHAGASHWRGRDDCNDFLDRHRARRARGRALRRRAVPVLAGLLGSLALRYPIAAVAGHEHVAPGRKNDPGAGFDWARLRRLAPSAKLAFAA
jgi:N-acetyl-anhydromuramyl-L-alanine amidase AmpD